MVDDLYPDVIGVDNAGFEQENKTSIISVIMIRD